MSIALVAHRRTQTNVALSRSRPDVRILSPAVAVRTLVEGDTAIARLDVAKRLDGIEIGLWELARLEGAGVRVLNRPRALVAAHDKLTTARALEAAGVAHPRTVHVESASARVLLEPPVVVKPRFGSWGRDVVRCEDVASLRRHLEGISARPWFTAHGALIQELIPPQGQDVRLVVAGGSVVGAVQRIAAPGEWRTNVALGAKRAPVQLTPTLCDLAVAATRAIEADLVGVDILPTPAGDYVVLELNGAVEFNEEYSIDGGDIFAQTLEALGPDRSAAVA